MAERQKLHLPRPSTMVPPLTPFTADGRVDAAGLARMVDYVVEDCQAGLVVAAGVEAQEYQYLGLEERKDLVRRTIDLVAGRRPVAVGISHPSMKQVLALADFAQECGAQALQLLAPMKPTGGVARLAELERYFRAVLDHSPLPLVLYLNAGPGADLSIKDTVELSKLEGIDYIKESSRDLARVSRLMVEIDHAGHAGYFTTMQMQLASLMLGGPGITLPPPAARIAHKINVAFTAGDLAEAARLQKQFALFPSRWMEWGLAATMKAVMRELGTDLGDPFPPYEPVPPAALAALSAQIRSMDF